MITSSLQISNGAGWYIEWFNDETEESSYWYGSRKQCEDRLKRNPPKKGWIKITSIKFVDQFDLACERRFD